MVNVHAVERDQAFLLPPSLAEWLPGDHLAWFVLDVVAELDLSGFYASLRPDGRGGASYDPQLMLGVLFYAYCVGERSSRRIERRLVEDVAFRVVAANQQPDHATLARFRRNHEKAIGEVFSQVLGLCVTEGLVTSSVVAIDGTKVEANASAWSNRTRRHIAEEILAEAEAADVADDQQFGERRGDELPDKWTDRGGRRARLREALRQFDADGAADWESYMAERQVREAELGRKLGGRKPRRETSDKAKTRQINTTDPDSRMLRARNRFVQGYNAQAAVSEDHIVVAAEVCNAANDSTQFQSMVTATCDNLADIDTDPVEVFVADAGYWNSDNVTMDIAAEVLIVPMPATQGITDPTDPRIVERNAVIARLDRGEVTVRAAAEAMGVSTTWARKLLKDHRSGRPDPAQLRNVMLERLATETGAAAYAKRKTTVEPVFGNLQRTLRTDRGVMVKNRDQWTIEAIHTDGAVTVTGRAGKVCLPADYAAEDLELGYAQTSHATQGRTVDTGLLLVDGPIDGRGLYTPLTRGRHTNHAYVVTSEGETAAEVLTQAITRDWIDQPAITRRTRLEADRVLNPSLGRSLLGDDQQEATHPPGHDAGKPDRSSDDYQTRQAINRSIEAARQRHISERARNRHTPRIGR